LPATIFAGCVRATRAIALAVSADLDANAGAVLKDALLAAGGRGGGSARTAQGTVPDDDRVDMVLQSLLSLPVTRTAP